MEMKRLSAIALFLLLISLTACGGGKESKSLGKTAEPSAGAEQSSVQTPDGSQSAKQPGEITADSLPDSLDLSGGYGYEEFLVLAATAERQGDACAGEGLDRQAYSFYAASAAELGSLRLCIEGLIAQKTGASIEDVSAGSLYLTYDELAALYPASPYPDYFEGLTHLASGEEDTAAEYWTRAVAGAAYPDEGMAFTYLTELDADALTALREELRGREFALMAKYKPELLYIERGPENSFTEYLLTAARETLTAGDYGSTAQYCEAAILADPFDGDCFGAAAVCALAASDTESMARYINEGLLIEPEHEGLQKLLEAYGHGGDPDEEEE